MLPFEGIKFRTETSTVREIVAGISKYAMGNSIDWITHLENIGILGITPALPSGVQLDATTQPDESKCSLSGVFKTIMKAIDALKGTARNKCSKVFSTIKTIISMLSNCLNTYSVCCHPTAGLLETRYVPELMHNVVLMQELLEKLIRNYGL